MSLPSALILSKVLKVKHPTVDTMVNLDLYASGDEEVKKEVIKFIKRNAKEVVYSKDWDMFQKNYASLVKEVFIAMAQ